ncbi:hypothetical protein CEXT_23591 [Caerostris extrusa]|uniref:Uncharacterized protein n=1 Tax=Caerostris extrusa TaxID=172846 RepID=A0AAV4P873_CAEEX|nr:hypothetical protein CEXT_23591 [Caerostris extrusa]
MYPSNCRRKGLAFSRNSGMDSPDGIKEGRRLPVSLQYAKSRPRRCIKVGNHQREGLVSNGGWGWGLRLQGVPAPLLDGWGIVNDQLAANRAKCIHEETNPCERWIHGFVVALPFAGFGTLLEWMAHHYAVRWMNRPVEISMIRSELNKIFVPKDYFKAVVSKLI